MSVSQAQLKNFLTALTTADSGATILGNPSGNTSIKSILKHHAVITNSIMAALVNRGYSALDYGGVNADSSGNSSAGLATAFSAADADERNLVILAGDYILSDSFRVGGTTYNNRRIDSFGHFFGQDSAVIFANKVKDMVWSGSTIADKLLIEDTYYSKFENFQVETLLVKPKNPSWGQFWTQFNNIKVNDSLIIDVGDMPVNQNIFLNIRATGAVIKESTANSKEAHSNTFINFDWTGGTLSNTTSKNQTNNIIGGYVESVPTGERAIKARSNFNTFGLTADVNNNVIQPNLHNWMIASSDHVARTVDYAPVAYNMFENGDLRFYPTSGLPDGFASNGGTASVRTDNSAPNISKRVIRVGSTVGQANKAVNIIMTGVNAPENTAFSIVFKGFFQRIEVQKADGTGPGYVTQHTIAPDTSDSDTSSWNVIHGQVATSVGDSVRLICYNVVAANAFAREMKIAHVSFTPVRVSTPFTTVVYGDFRDGGDRVSATTSLGNVDSYDLIFKTNDTQRVRIDSADNILGVGAETTFGITNAGSNDLTIGSVVHLKDESSASRLILEGTNAIIYLSDFDAGSNDKAIQFINSDGQLRLRSDNDGGSQRLNNIMNWDLGTGNVAIGGAANGDQFVVVDNDTMAYGGIQTAAYVSANNQDAFWFDPGGDTLFVKNNGTVRFILTTAYSGSGH